MRVRFLTMFFGAAVTVGCHQDESASNSERNSHMGGVHAAEPPAPSAAPPPSRADPIAHLATDNATPGTAPAPRIRQ